MMRYLIRIALLGFVALIVAGCNIPFSSKANAPTPTTSLASTVPPSATPSISLEHVRRTCGANFAPQGVQGQIGNLVIALIQVRSDPSLKLPDNMPSNKPYSFTRQLDPLHPEPTDLLANVLGYRISICNTSQSTSYKLVSLGMRIQSLIVDTNSANILDPCSMAMQPTDPLVEGRCGGALGPHEGFEVTWPSAVYDGTIGSVSQDVSDQWPSFYPTPVGGYVHYGYFPTTLPPGQVIWIDLVNNAPTQNGTYTFQFGMQVDDLPMLYLPTPLAPVFLFTHPQLWSGDACFAPGSPYASQIPKTSDLFYVCPDPAGTAP
jgi:hypothetical protein